MRHICVVAATAAVLSACQTTTDGGPVTTASTASAPQADLPPNYRALIRAAVRDKFFDPYSIRDAAISQPIQGARLRIGGRLYVAPLQARRFARLILALAPCVTELPQTSKFNRYSWLDAAPRIKSRVSYFASIALMGADNAPNLDRDYCRSFTRSAHANLVGG